MTRESADAEWIDKDMIRSVTVEERCGERVAGNVADLQAHPFGEARQSWTRADPSAEIPLSYICVSRYSALTAAITEIACRVDSTTLRRRLYT